MILSEDRGSQNVMYVEMAIITFKSLIQMNQKITVYQLNLEKCHITYIID